MLPADSQTFEIRQGISEMLSVSEALNLVLQDAKPGPAEPILLADCLSRVIAQDLLVTSDSPLFDKALMDGFAVCVRDRVSSSAAAGSSSQTFPIAETITAGCLPGVRLHLGLASRIMTGAQLPLGCNCVVPIEQVQFHEQQPETVTIPTSAMSPEANIMRRGAAARAGSVLLRAGTRLQPQHIAALAEFGIGTLSVHRRPSMAVLATGDELIAIDQPLEPGKIRNSNEPMLLAQGSVSGAVPISLGIARDDVRQLRQAIELGLQHDFFLLTGGVSAGLLDLVPQQLREAGVQQVFHGVHMKPGKPLWFGTRVHKSRCLVFGLPGNPVSSLACFELFVRPAIQVFCGLSPASSTQAVLSDPVQIKGDRPVYQPVFVSIDDRQVNARPVPWSSSSDLRATVEANGMALLQPEHGPYRSGESVEVWLWGDQRI